MVTSLAFWKFGGLRRLFRLEIRDERVVRKAIEHFNSSADLLERTQTEGAPEFSDSGKAYAAVKAMLKSLKIIIKRGGDMADMELIALHRLEGSAEEIIKTYLQNLEDNFAMKKAINALKQGVKSLLTATTENRRSAHHAWQNISQRLRYFSTTTNRRSAMQTESQTFEERKNVLEFVSIEKRINSEGKKFLRNKEKYANAFAEVVMEGGELLQRIGKESIENFTRQMRILLASNEYLADCAQKLQELREKGVNLNQVDELEKELAVVLLLRVTVFRKFTAKSDYAQSKDAARLEMATA